MKFIFIVQGEGRDHLTQAITLEEVLLRNGHQVTEILVGESASRTLPGFFNRTVKAPVKRFISPNFLPTAKNTSPALTRSVIYNVARTPTFVRSLWYIRKRIEASGADVVINFYELLTGMVYLFHKPSVPQIAIGHQYLFLHREFRFPRKYSLEYRLLKLFTRLTAIGAKEKLALSFRKYSDDPTGNIRVVPPLLRKEVLSLDPEEGDSLLGYMVNAGFAEEVLRFHRRFPEVKMDFFWDKSGAADEEMIDPTLSFHRIDDMKFLRLMSRCKGYATTSGFESVCEAMYLGKPVLMVPAHIEQECNAWDAVECGAGVSQEEFDFSALITHMQVYRSPAGFREWVQRADSMMLDRLEQQDCPVTGFTAAPVCTG